MKKVLLAAACAVGFGLWAFAQKSEIQDNMMAYIESLMEQTPEYTQAWNKEVKAKETWNYIDGVFLNSLVQLSEEAGSPEEKAHYMDFVEHFVNYFINEEGKFVNARTQKEKKLGKALDDICESRILFDLMNYSQDSRYKGAVDATYSRLMSFNRAYGTNGKKSLNFEHKSQYPGQIWLDGMYMYAPFYARYANYTGRTEIFDEIAAQYRFINQNMKDKKTGLLFHGIDTTIFFDRAEGTSNGVFWADKKTGNSRSFWLRSMGWYVVSLVDVIEYVPDSKKEVKKELEKYLADTMKALMKYQDKDTKMFWQVVDQGNKSFKIKRSYFEGLGNMEVELDKNGFAEVKNYVEASGSAMIAYVCMKGARMGSLKKTYGEKGKEIFEGIYRHSYDRSTRELKDICITAGLGPYNREVRDGSPEYYLAEPKGSNDAKGVGPFIMAFIEYRR